MIMPSVNQSSANAKGIFWQVVGMLFFGSMDAVSKHLTLTLPVVEILWIRYLFFRYIWVFTGGSLFRAQWP